MSNVWNVFLPFAHECGDVEVCSRQNGGASQQNPSCSG